MVFPKLGRLIFLVVSGLLWHQEANSFEHLERKSLTAVDTATTPLYTPAWVKAMPLEERGVAVVAVVPAASSRVHNILEASRGC